MNNSLRKKCLFLSAISPEPIALTNSLIKLHPYSTQHSAESTEAMQIVSCSRCVLHLHIIERTTIYLMSNSSTNKLVWWKCLPEPQALPVFRSVLLSELSYVGNLQYELPLMASSLNIASSSSSSQASHFQQSQSSCAPSRPSQYQLKHQ